MGPMIKGVKGLFRMTRRYGEYDAKLSHILKATLGVPPRDRPVIEFDRGMVFHDHHLGFDHRQLEIQLKEEFRVIRTACSPIKWLGTWINFEVNYVLEAR